MSTAALNLHHALAIKVEAWNMRPSGITWAEVNKTLALIAAQAAHEAA